VSNKKKEIQTEGLNKCRCRENSSRRQNPRAHQEQIIYIYLGFRV
jgi:hypothetical protein